MSRAGARVAALLVLGVAALPGAAGAHTRSVSYSSWKLDARGASVRVRIPLLELSRLAFDPALDTGTDGRAARYLATHLLLRAGKDVCGPTAPPVAEPSPEGWAHFRWSVACPSGGARSIESHVLERVAPSHLHFARVAPEGGEVRERVLTDGDRSWALTAAGGASGSAGAGTSLLGYVGLGVKHILTGRDHLAFVLALLLLATSLREVASLVTAFTVAHSVTLGLAVLGVVRPDGAAVESLIGYSIALVAAENGWLLAGGGPAVPAVAVGGTAACAVLAATGLGTVPALALAGLALFAGCHFGLLARVERPARLRAAVAFAFGLVHGFGFAGVLTAMELPTERLVSALFGFNAGVEIGQLAVVALAWPALQTIARWSPHVWRPRVAEAGSAAICGLGLFWFLARAFG